MAQDNLNPTAINITLDDLPPLIGMRLREAVRFAGACGYRCRMKSFDGKPYVLEENEIVLFNRLNLDLYHGVVIGAEVR